MSIWGALTNSIQVFDGCDFVSTESHGGVVLSEYILKNHPDFEKLKTYPHIKNHYGNGNYYFEEDCEASMVVYLLNDEHIAHIFPDAIPKHIRDMCLKTFVNDYPDFFTHVTGKELSIFDSRVLWDTFIKSNPEHYFIKNSYSDSWLNVPLGHTVFTAENGKNESVTLIATCAEYNNLISLALYPLDIKSYKQFKLDFDMPRTKPKHKLQHGFRIVRTENIVGSENNEVTAKAYSYETGEIKYFKTTADYLRKSIQAIDSSNWITYTDESHTELTEDAIGFVREIEKV